MHACAVVTAVQHISLYMQPSNEDSSYEEVVIEPSNRPSDREDRESKQEGEGIIIYEQVKHFQGESISLKHNIAYNTSAQHTSAL